MSDEIHPPDKKPSFWRALLHVLNPLEWISLGVTITSMLLSAFRHATLDQVKEGAVHMRNPLVPGPAKALLMVSATGAVLVVVIIWIIIHGLLPFLLLSVVEDIFLLVLLLALEFLCCWVFNYYARSSLPPP